MNRTPSEPDPSTRAVSGTNLLPREFTAFEFGIRVLLASLLVSIALAQIVAAVLVLLWIDLMVRGKYPYRRTVLDIPILVYVGVRLLSVAFSEYPSMSMLAITRELVFYVSYFFSAFYFQHASKENITRTLRVLIGVTLIVTVISCVMYLAGLTVRANGLTGGGTLATHLSIITSLVLVRGNNRGLIPGRFSLWIVLLIMMGGLLCSLFRGDTIAVIVVLCIYSLRFNRRLLAGAVVFAAVILLLVPPVRAKFQTLTDPLQHTSDRLTLWKNAASRAGEHPLLGFGPETFPVVFTDVAHLDDKFVGGWHNDTIQLYIESGTLGLIAWYTIVVIFIWHSARAVRRGPGNPEYETGWIGLLMIVAYLISGSFGTPTFSITNALLFRFLLAMVIAGTAARPVPVKDAP